MSRVPIQYSKRQKAEGRRLQGKRLIGKGFNIWRCPNLPGGCYIHRKQDPRLLLEGSWGFIQRSQTRFPTSASYSSRQGG
ncbi:MAG: hypothetical protein F6K41_18495 [Symploca sp. SIO3E6]|nr:hypothetical protein [Caldora sp. SIO3E6]